MRGPGAHYPVWNACIHRVGCHLALAHFASHRCGPSSTPGLGRGRMCEKFHQLLAVGRWFPPGTPVSSTRKLISSSSFHRLDMTLAVAEALNPNKPNQSIGLAVVVLSRLDKGTCRHTQTHYILQTCSVICVSVCLPAPPSLFLPPHFKVGYLFQKREGY